MFASNECDTVADLPISGHLAGRPLGWCRFLGNYVLFTGADRTSCTLHDCRMKVGSVEPLSEGAGFVVQLLLSSPKYRRQKGSRRMIERVRGSCALHAVVDRF
jgi:hypothetical protein